MLASGAATQAGSSERRLCHSKLRVEGSDREHHLPRPRGHRPTQAGRVLRAGTPRVQTAPSGASATSPEGAPTAHCTVLVVCSCVGDTQVWCCSTKCLTVRKYSVGASPTVLLPRLEYPVVELARRTLALAPKLCRPFRSFRRVRECAKGPQRQAQRARDRALDSPSTHPERRGRDRTDA